MKECNEVNKMNPESTVDHPGLVTKALAVCSIATFWMIPFSPFVTMAALVRTKNTVGWPRRLSVAATLLCSLFTVTYASMLFFVTIYILKGGLNQ